MNRFLVAAFIVLAGVSICRLFYAQGRNDGFEMAQPLLRDYRKTTDMCLEDLERLIRER